MTRATVQDMARLKAGEYAVIGHGSGWVLVHESDPSIYTGALMVGEHGCLSPTQWEAVAEGLGRIAQEDDGLTYPGEHFCRYCEERIVHHPRSFRWVSVSSGWHVCDGGEWHSPTWGYREGRGRSVHRSL